MKKLLILILIALALSGKGNDKYLFTDTKTDLNGNLTADPATWIFDFEKSTITVQTETEDAIFTFYSYQRIKSIEDDIQYDKYILDTGGAIYVDNNINGSQFLQIIYCKDDKQYIFRNK